MRALRRSLVRIVNYDAEEGLPSIEGLLIDVH